MRKLLLFAVSLFMAGGVFAQFQGNVFVEDSVIRVQHGSRNLPIAWAGGTSNPEPAMADLNKDGLNDMVLFEWSTGQVKTFINKGTFANPNYVYSPKFAKNFPTDRVMGVVDYLIMLDYNRDGIQDLFHKGSTGFRVLRGYWNAENELAFTFYRDLKFQSPVFGLVPAYSQTSDIPGIADIDGDGDIDFLGFEVTGSHIRYFKNCQVEQGLPNDSIRICNPESCWGQMTQTFERTYQFGATNCNLQGLFGCKTAMHAGNCMALIDMDGDGDMDFLDGNISFSDIQYTENLKAQFGTRDSMFRQDTTWQSVTGGHKLNMSTWPAASYVDVDCDGKRDIVIAPHAQGISENVKTMALYRNTGTATTPNFVYQNDSFFVQDMVDFGTASYPVLYDYNKDGRPDLIVGSDGYFNPSGNLRSSLAYYENKLINGRATFVLQSKDLALVNAQNFQGAAPTIGDLDNDGKDDLVLGHTDGSLSFYKNMATNASIQPVWLLSQRYMTRSTNDTINVGYYAAPFIYDLDKDGKKDLVIGHQGGTLHFYKNIGGVGQLRMEYVTDSLGKMVANSNNKYSGFSVPFIGRIDNTPSDYIVLGNDSGYLRRYTGFQNGNVTTAYTAIDSQYSRIKSGLRSAPAFADLNADGKYDLVMGNQHGGLSLYRQELDVVVGVPHTSAAQGIRLYPNPASESITLAWDAPLGTDALCRIFDASGRVVSQEKIIGGSTSTSVSVQNLSSGIYQCVVETDGLKSIQKFTVIR